MLRKILLMAGTVIGVTTLEFFLTWCVVTYFRDSWIVKVLLSLLDLVYGYTQVITAWWPMSFMLGLPGIIAILILGFKLGRTGRERGCMVVVGLVFWMIAYVASVLFLFVWFANNNPSHMPIGR